MTAQSRTAGESLHAHRDCSNRDRVWLARERAEPASAARHPYCVECGTVRNMAKPQAKPLGFYLNGVAALREYLEHDPLRSKLARVHGHLIAARLAIRPEYEDAYGTPGQMQLDAYVNIVRSVRPDLDDELILRLLPGPRRRRQNEAPEGGKTPAKN